MRVDLNTYFTEVPKNRYFYDTEAVCHLYNHNGNRYVIHLKYTYGEEESPGYSIIVENVVKFIPLTDFVFRINKITNRYIDVGQQFDRVAKNIYLYDNKSGKMFYFTKYGNIINCTSVDGKYPLLSVYGHSQTEWVSIESLVNVKSNQEENKMNQKDNSKGFIIGNLHDGVVKLSSTPMVHGTMLSAKNEINRLAIAHSGTKFVLLEIKNYVVANAVTWE
jgi:hypothetical protein